MHAVQLNKTLNNLQLHFQNKSINAKCARVQQKLIAWITMWIGAVAVSPSRILLWCFIVALGEKCMTKNTYYLLFLRFHFVYSQYSIGGVHGKCTGNNDVVHTTISLSVCVCMCVCVLVCIEKLPLLQFSVAVVCLCEHGCSLSLRVYEWVNVQNICQHYSTSEWNVRTKWKQTEAEKISWWTALKVNRRIIFNSCPFSVTRTLFPTISSSISINLVGSKCLKTPLNTRKIARFFVLKQFLT